MRENIREEMSRYPVFSCSNVDSFMDESELFKDEEIKNSHRPNALRAAKNQTITNIYDRITINSHHENLRTHREYLKNRQHYQNHSTNATARQSRNQLSQAPKIGNGFNTVSKFMSELAKSLQGEGPAETIDVNKRQKISLMKRIIDHYHIKSSEKKYYSNLIKTYGMRIESVNSSDFAVKKSLHPRETVKGKEFNQSAQLQSGKQKKEQKYDLKIFQKRSQIRKVGPADSFLFQKHSEGRYSRKTMKTQERKRISQNKNRDSTQLDSSKKLNPSESKRLTISTEIHNKIIQKPLKLQNVNSIESKINKYREFLFLVNFSNGFYRQLQVEKYELTFKFYVGRGNNRNLIRSVMKKRFWFEETTNLLEASFVWVQLKNVKFFEKQVSPIRPEEEKSMELDLIFTTSSKEKEEKKKSEQNLITIPDLMRSTKFKKAEKNKNQSKITRVVRKAKDYAPTNPLRKILSETDTQNYNSIKDSLMFRKNPTFLQKIRSSQTAKSIETELSSKIQNHLPQNGLLGNKKAMYYNLREFCRRTNRNLSEYVPLTFHIKKGLLDDQFRNMCEIFNDKRKEKSPNYWIMKPGQFSNRGQGISCTNKLEEVKKRLMKCQEANKSTKGLNQNGKCSSLIVQEYISSPLLYNARKFDIRVFMLVTVNNGKIKGYWYQEGYIRTSSFVWSLSQIEDKYIHLTNDAIQKNCEQYGLYEAGNKLGYNELQRYLSTLPRNGRNLNFFEEIYPRMRAIAADLIKATFLNLDPRRLRDNFQLFGLDFMIDNNFKPWLIEANTNPCLELSCPLLERIIPHMIQNALRITLDPLFPPPSAVTQNYKYSIPENALHYNKFELIFDEEEEGPVLRRLYKQSRIMQEIDEFEEDKEQFEEEGEMLEIDET